MPGPGSLIITLITWIPDALVNDILVYPQAGKIVSDMVTFITGKLVILGWIVPLGTPAPVFSWKIKIFIVFSNTPTNNNISCTQLCTV